MEAFDIKCPDCGSFANLGRQMLPTYSCKECGSMFYLMDHLCPYCFSYSNDPRTSCQECGSALSQICDHCGLSNWPGYIACFNCGKSLDILTQIAARHSPDMSIKRLDRQMQQAKTLNTLEEIRAEKSRRELEAIETERRTRLDLMQQTHQSRERQLLLVAGIILIIFISVLLLLGILSIAT